MVITVRRQVGTPGGEGKYLGHLALLNEGVLFRGDLTGTGFGA